MQFTLFWFCVAQRKCWKKIKWEEKKKKEIKREWSHILARDKCVLQVICKKQAGDTPTTTCTEFNHLNQFSILESLKS